jgi:multidrug efflux pump subunit AcrA (membrane-fusion protein)
MEQRHTDGLATDADNPLRMMIDHMPTLAWACRPERALLPGMFANVQFAIMRAEPPLWLPATALILGAGGIQVALMRDAQTVHFQTVEVGRDLGQTVEIVAGLTGTELVIVNGGDGLREGLRVRPGE